MTIPEPQRLQSILDSFCGKDVLVFGDAMLDEYWWGSVSRISPEAPVPVVGVEKTGHKPGGAANVALNIAALGGSPRLVSVTGDDTGRELLLAALGEKNVDTSGLVIDTSRPTTRKTRIVAHSQQVVRADFELTDQVPAGVEARLWEIFLDRFACCRGVIISDYGKGVITGELLRKIIAQARAEGKFVVVDPKDTHFFSYRGVTTLTPNHHEAGFVAGRRITDENSLREVGFDLLRRLEADSLLITRGAQGMALFEPPIELTHFPTRATEVFDVTGAGDTVISAVAMALAAGASMKEAAYLANFAAGLVIREIGTAQTTTAALAEAVMAADKGTA
jgi:D-beta-D-heptose 7-phosphate kinase/D-beta-D-heptose 1-phosphate adenosyltransferase